MKSIKELRKICQKPVVAENHWYVRHVIRTISIYFTKLFLHTPIGANQISLLMIFIGVAGGFFFALGTYINGLIGVICLQLFLILDCVDGEVARYKNQCSSRGQYLDLIANDIVHVAAFLGLTIGMLNGNYKIPVEFLSHNNVILAFGLSAIISPLLYKIAVHYAKEVCGKCVVLSDSLSTNKKGSPLASLLRAVLYPTSIINIITVAAILDLLPFALVGYGIILPLWWIVSTMLRFRAI